MQGHGLEKGSEDQGVAGKKTIETSPNACEAVEKQDWKECRMVQPCWKGVYRFPEK